MIESSFEAKIYHGPFVIGRVGYIIKNIFYQADTYNNWAIHRDGNFVIAAVDAPVYMCVCLFAACGNV